MKFSMNSIGKKIAVLCTVVVVVSLLICGAVTLYETSEFGKQNLLNNLNDNMQIMDNIITGKLNILSNIGHSNAEMISSIGLNNTERLEHQEKIAKNAARADFAIITDKNGNVIADSNGKSEGSKVCYPIVSKALSGKTIKSFEVIDAESMEKEGLSNLQVGNKKEGLALVYAQPLKDSAGNIIGSILLADVLNNDFNIVDTVSSKNTIATIFLDNTRISTSVKVNGKRAVGTTASDKVYDTVINRGKEYIGEAKVVGTPMLTLYKPIKNSDGKIIGMTFVGVPEGYLIDSLNKIKFTTVGIIILAIILSIAIATIGSRTITKPIRELMEAVEEVAKGHYVNVEVNSNDEIGKLAKSFNKMVEDIKTLIETQEKDKKVLAQTFEEIGKVMQKVADGDLSVRLDEGGKHNKLQKIINKALSNIQILTKELKKEIENLNSEIKALREGTERAKEISDQVADAASQVATAATDQSTKLQDVSQDIGNTGEVVDNAYNAAVDAVESVNEIEENSETGLKKVEHATETMQRIANLIDDLGKSIQQLGDRSKKINEVTVLIKDIAEQTGLLALNASIEAARAGEAGKGFAVVASEIKSLAEEIGKSVEDINKTIIGIQNQVEKTVDLGLSGKDEVDKGVIAIDEVNNAFMKIKESVDNAAEKINAIKEGTKQASENVQESLRNVQDIASISEEFAATAEELTASAEEQNRTVGEISDATEKIADISNRLFESANKFKI